MAEGTDTPTTVRLRAVEDGDLDVFFDHQADPEAAEMAAFPSRDRERFAAYWAKLRADDTMLSRTVLVDGLVAGGLNGWRDHDRQMVGYWVGRKYWGRGVATRALTLFLKELPVRPAYAHVAAHNAGSIRVLRKCGFQRDRVAETRAPQREDGIQEYIFVLA